MSHNLKLLCWTWCFLILTLCGCSSMVHAQACVGGSCVVPQPVRPIPREARPYRPVLNVVIPRRIPASYERFNHHLRTDPAFRKALCPVQPWYIDNMPDYARRLIVERGMPYFYYSDSTDAYVVGFDDPDEFLEDVQAMRPEARAAAAAKKKRLQAQQEAEQAAEREKAEEQSRREQEAADEAKAAEEEAAEQKRQEEAEAAERERLQIQEQQRLERERDTEEIESPDPSPRPAPTPPKPSIKDEIRQGVRNGAKVAGKAAVRWAMPHIFEALGITPNVAAALAVVGGGGTIGAGAILAYMAIGGLWKLRQKKTEQPQNKP